MLARIGGVLSNVAAALWGKFESREEVRKFAFLALIFFMIIGVYWTLRPFKDSVFGAVVGKRYLWLAKIVSPIVIVPLVILYGKLVEMFPRQKVFYLLMAIYGPLALLFAFAFMHPTIGLLNTAAAPTRLIGWMWYVFVETFGSLVIALFWAFVADTTAPNSAKRGFPVVYMVGQMGNALGPALLNTQTLGTATSAPIVAICGGLILFTGVLFWFFMRVTPSSQLAGYQAAAAHEKKNGAEPGFMDGIRLLLTESYLLGLFLLVGIYEMLYMIIEYNFKQNALSLPTEAASSAYLSTYAMYVGIFSFLCVFLGINNITRRLGMLPSLLVMPLAMLVFMFLTYYDPGALTLSFWVIVCVKALNYALNQPSLKQLYIPTTPDAKYKSQAWIETFGSRGSKSITSFYNGLRETVLSIDAYMAVALVATGGLVGLWVLVIMHVSKLYNRAIARDEVVC